MAEPSCCISLGYANESLKAQADDLSLHLGLKIDNQASHQLYLSEKGLVLKWPPFSNLHADFSAAALKKNQAAEMGLIKACKPKSGLYILDATAGWGRDAALLANFGAKVLMLERHPILAALLKEGLKKAKPGLSLSLEEADAFSYLETLEEKAYPDLIYLDPMHPERKKKALVKKELQVLQQLLGEDKDALELLCLARKRTKDKVIVKWPTTAKPLLPPLRSIVGKTVRFDIYAFCDG